MRTKARGKVRAAVALIAGLLAIVYSTIITIYSAEGGCAKIFGGPGCGGDTHTGLYVAMGIIFGFCYLVPFCQRGPVPGLLNLEVIPFLPIRIHGGRVINELTSGHRASNE